METSEREAFFADKEARRISSCRGKCIRKVLLATPGTAAPRMGASSIQGTSFWTTKATAVDIKGNEVRCDAGRTDRIL